MPQIVESGIIRERIAQVRRIMREQQMDLYIIFTGDYHLSEYAGEYFAERAFLSGFTGSAGTLVITPDSAALFTDGRYFVQAAQQLYNTGIELMKAGCAGVPTLEEYCVQQMPVGGTAGLDGRTVGAVQGLGLEQAVQKKNAKMNFKFNAVGQIWPDRPPFPLHPAYPLCVGETRAEKLLRLREKMSSLGADLHLLATLDDICWLLNLRGSDVACNPVLMSYAVVTADRVVLFTDQTRFSAKLRAMLSQDQVEIRPYEQIYEVPKRLRDTTVLLDPARVNLTLYRCLAERETAGVRLLKAENPTVLMKAVKNPAEIAQLRAVHIEDGLAVTRFLYWLKNAVQARETVTEASAAARLDELRSEIPDFIGLSFDTISAYNENAAMMHYHAAPGCCARLKPEGLLLVDSGGQYLRGTTDVTRTAALGPVTAEMKKFYTLALKGMLALSDARFLKGCTGYNLDILARQPLWNEGVDYRCGTGHGIGFLLNVHEGPNGFRWHHRPGRNDLCEILPGMVTSNEPGVYMEGRYGIRIENEIVCVQDFENEYGTFLRFDTLTCVPLEPELIEPGLLTQADLDRLNRYHRWVYEQLSPYMKGDELVFLEQSTRPL